MDEDFIDKKLIKNPVTNPYYWGTFPADKIPNVNTFPASLIVNMDNSNLPGSHWVAMFLPNFYTCYYFDSFGFEPLNENIQKYLKKFYVIKNEIPFQSPSSDVCGHYVLYFVYMCSLGYKPKNIKKILHSQKNTDDYVKKFVNCI